ncbi:hypothetical protein [Thermoflexus hugenholtzii]
MIVQLNFRGLALIMLLSTALAFLTGLTLGSREWLNPAEARRKDAETERIVQENLLELKKREQELRQQLEAEKQRSEARLRAEEEHLQLELLRQRLLIYVEFAGLMLFIILPACAALAGMIIVIRMSLHQKRAYHEPWEDLTYRRCRREEARARERMARAAALEETIHPSQPGEDGQTPSLEIRAG